MKKFIDSIYALADYVMQIRPDLTDDQVAAATVALHEELRHYLTKSKGHPSIMKAIYEAGLTDEEYAAYSELDYNKQVALYWER